MARRPRSWRLQVWLIAGVVLLLVSGCASGTARDAQRAEEIEATRGVVLPGLQATSVVDRFFPPSPTPGPTRTPMVTLESLVVTTSVGPDGRPQGASESVPGSGTIYVAAHLHDLTAGQSVIAVWGTLEAAEIARAETTVESSSGDRWIALPWHVNGSVAPGQYAVYLYVDGTLIYSLVFRMF